MQGGEGIIVGGEVDILTRLAQLFSDHGIYAVFAVFLYLFWRMSRASGASQRIVLWATPILAVLVTGFWIYSNFVYEPKIVVEGTIKQLSEQPVMPSKLGDKAKLVHRLTPFRSDLRFYTAKDPTAEGYDLNWALVSTRGFHKLLLTFQQEYCDFEPQEEQDLLTASLEPQATLGPQLRGDTVKGYASLDFKIHERLLKEQIHIVYNGNTEDPVRKLGKLFIVVDDKWTEIPWVKPETATRTTGSAALQSGPLRHSWLGGVAWAQSPPRQADPLPSLQQLKLDLASPDLAKQIAATDQLVKGRAASIPVIKRLLIETAPDAHGSNLLIQNLAGALGQLEASQVAIDSELNRLMGEALYKAGDYEHSARFLGKVTGESLTPPVLFQRGLSFLNTQKYDAAVQDFSSYLLQTSNPQKKSQALTNLGVAYNRKGDRRQARAYLLKAAAQDPKNATAHFNLGVVERTEGNLDASERAFEKVLDLDPKSITARIQLASVYERQGRLDQAASILNGVLLESPRDPRALNNLAYIYAQKGVRLPEALRHVDLAIEIGGPTSSYLDTKGWILHRMGSSPQALPILRKAAEQDPQSAEIRKHLEEVQKSVSGEVVVLR